MSRDVTTLHGSSTTKIPETFSRVTPLKWAETFQGGQLDLTSDTEQLHED